MTAEALTTLPEWNALLKHAEVLKASALSSVILGDNQRLESCALTLGGLTYNYALNLATPETVRLLAQLAVARSVEVWRSNMWNGEKINTTENRAALHIALRQSGNAPIMVDGKNIVAEITATQKRIFDFAEKVRTGHHVGATGQPIKHVVNIGIGGSDLGPRLVVGALAPYATKLGVHFVANADAFELTQLFQRLNPAETLFVVVSKTFTTQETLLNAHTAREWIVKHLGEKAPERHFVGVSTNVAAVQSFGILPELAFPMWDWVGGRFSVWSSVGLSVVMAIGQENYAQFLRGAEDMDAHFKSAPLDKNIPVVMAMLGIWSRNFLNRAAHVVLPYSERLRELPRYLQQLEMESNGKTVGRDGKSVAIATTPALFGEPGTVGQHGFHQWLHQGSDIVSADFIGITKDDLGYPQHHRALLSNMVAQAGALAFGQKEANKPQDVYEGNRGSNILLLEQLDPHSFGMLLALYEHKVFVQSVIWGINPFDQPGVELGKQMARALASGGILTSQGSGFLAELYAKLLS